MNNFLGADTPGIGQYSPIKGGIEDSVKIKKIRRKYEMYSVQARKNSNNSASFKSIPNDHTEIRKLNTVEYTGADPFIYAEQQNRTEISFPKLSESILKTGEGPEHFISNNEPMSARR